MASGKVTGNTAGFCNGASTTNEYTYNYNGNLTKDSNKGIANISWNSLNLPSVVSFSDGSTVTYTYAADGTKLRTVHDINGTITQTDYCGSAIYENGIAKFWQTEAGYISMDDSKYHYYLQDHQGNNRVVVSENGATEEVNHYYAFGGLFSSDENVQPFKYNGKELDTKKELNWYDYGARQYDTTLGRFISADTSAENYYDTGIYAYCGSNPVNRIDPTGTDWYQDENGNYLWQRGSDNLEGFTNIGSTVSMELGENSFLNFYQNGGVWANQAVNAIDLIYASPKLQDQFLGYGSVLSEEDQISLFRALMSREGAELVQPIMQEGLSWIVGGLGGKALGKAVGWGLFRIFNNAATKGFKSFAAFKKSYGSAGKGMAWHHIVEQNPDNIAKFGAERIHNINNMVKLPHGKGSIHAKVTGYYNSKYKGTNIRIRDYVNTLSYEEQYEFGINVLKKIGWKQ